MKKLTCLMALGLMVVGFQNCSQVAFENMRGDLTGKTGFAAGPEIIDVIDKDIIVKDDSAGDDQVVDNDDYETPGLPPVGDGDDGGTETPTEVVDDKDDGDDGSTDTPTEVVDNNDDGEDDGKDNGKDDKVVLDEGDQELYACGNEGQAGHKVMICHNDKGDGKRKSQCIDKHALQAHLAHSKAGHTDNMGACPGEELASAD